VPDGLCVATECTSHAAIKNPGLRMLEVPPAGKHRRMPESPGSPRVKALTAPQ